MVVARDSEQTLVKPSVPVLWVLVQPAVLDEVPGAVVIDGGEDEEVSRGGNHIREDLAAGMVCGGRPLN